MKKAEVMLSLLRIAMGVLFTWAFFDKVFGLGFATTSARAWIHGGSPTSGFLKFTDGTFSPIFQFLSGIQIIDWLFMLGLLGIGLAMLSGIGLRIAGYAGAVFGVLLYLSVFPPQNNPVIDEHLIYSLIFLVFSTGEVGRRYSLYLWWSKQALVKKYSFLQ
ncbi:MAG: hypothetical protein AAB478_04925 [Patescibacteria group bacterium]